MNGTIRLLTAARHALTACAFTLLLVSGAMRVAEAAAPQSVSYQLDIPSQDLQGALQALALASHHKLLYRAELVAGKTSRALHGTYTTEEAVRQLLGGTDLDFKITPESVVLIKSTRESTSGEVSYSRRGILVASASAEQSSGPVQDGQQQPSQEAYQGPSELQAIVVTAEKRSENAQKVPISLSVISGADLQRQGIRDVSDIAQIAPGIAVQRTGPGENTVVIRGVWLPRRVCRRPPASTMVRCPSRYSGKWTCRYSTWRVLKSFGVHRERSTGPVPWAAPSNMCRMSRNSIVSRRPWALAWSTSTTRTVLDTKPTV